MKKKLQNLSTINYLLLFLTFLPNLIQSQGFQTTIIDSVVNEALATFEVPGIAVAIIKDNKVVHSKGYGIRSLTNKLPVDEKTLFGIASNAKAFLTATLGILVDEGKLNWDDKVIDYIPEFRLYDPYVTNDFTITDLVTHRSGLGLGAGDLMFFPDSSNFTIDDIIYNLRYLKQTSPFRTKYDYDNLLYMVAGEVVKRVSGESWDSFVESRIMKPLGMNNSASSFTRLKDKSNVIDGHVSVDGKVRVVNRHISIDADSPAGGVYSNLTDLSNWLIMHLNNGQYGINNEYQLFSKDVHKYLWTPQTIMPLNRKVDKYNTHFKCYGLGWLLSDVNGLFEVSHGGSLDGMVSHITIYPELNSGIIVLTNQQSIGSMLAITNIIKDIFFGMEITDWIDIYKSKENRIKYEGENIKADIWERINRSISSDDDAIDLTKYCGTYSDSWFGDVTISTVDNRLFFRSHRSPKLSGEMFYFKGNTFIVKWDIRNFDADAYVKFNLDIEGNPHTIEMEAISPFTDFSYDFHDLNMKRKKN